MAVPKKMTQAAQAVVGSKAAKVEGNGKAPKMSKEDVAKLLASKYQELNRHVERALLLMENVEVPDVRPVSGLIRSLVGQASTKRRAETKTYRAEQRKARAAESLKKLEEKRARLLAQLNA